MVLYSLLSGLCALIPIPFLDDRARDFLRQRLTVKLAAHHGRTLDRAAVKMLACGDQPFSLGGCLRSIFSGTLFKMALYLLRKLFSKILHKILFILALNDCVNDFSRTFHEACLNHHALASGAPAPPDLPATRVRSVVEAICSETDTRPFRKLVYGVLRGSRKLLVRGTRELMRVLWPLRRRSSGEEPPIYEPVELAEEERILGGLVDSLTAIVGGQMPHLRELEGQLAERLPLPETTPHDVNSHHA